MLINTSKVQPGQMVISKAGRDHGRRFLVLRVVDDQFLELADGDLRKVESPKRKKVKHVQLTNRVSKGIADKLEQKDKITNAMVRKELENLDLETNLD